MTEIRRYSLAAVIGLVLLRLGIGWQLLYEGLWKIDTRNSAEPWTSEGYLKNSQGPMRSVFQSLAGDPNDLSWLDAEAVEARWDDWKLRFASHYRLSPQQIARLNQMVDGAASFAAALPALPAGVDFKALRLDSVMSFDPQKKLLVVNGARHLLPTEKQALEEQVADKSGEAWDAYRKALNEVFTRASRLSYKERMRAHLKGNPDNAGLIHGRISQLDLYNEMVQRYEQKLTSARMAFEFDHLNRTLSDSRAKSTELIGPVKAMDAELRKDAVDDILTVDQIQRGPMPEPWTSLRVVDLLTITGLTGLGILLILGLFTRFAAISAALMVFGFYMAMPPFPGVPEAPGPEHSFIVNKNLIEVLALLALAAVPTGYWFGLDKVLAGFSWRRRRKTE